MKQSREILIVGAGLAGTTIARVLAENLIKVKILEKRIISLEMLLISSIKIMKGFISMALIFYIVIEIQ